VRTASVVVRSRGSFPLRRLLVIVLACLAALLSASLLGCASAQRGEEEVEPQSSTTDQPNIVFVLTDDLDYASAQKMPEIRSQLIEKGTSLENAFISFPVLSL
jgi:hypothetical protein